jgi:SOS response associated peptidase (SRAP)
MGPTGRKWAHHCSLPLVSSLQYAPRSGRRGRTQQQATVTLIRRLITLHISRVASSPSWSPAIPASSRMRNILGINRTRKNSRSDTRPVTIQSTTMCGRYRLSRRAEVLATYGAEYEGVDRDAHSNIAPTQNVPVVGRDASEPIRRASVMRWELIPSWAKEPAIGAGMINARAETAAEKPSFRAALESRRCLIPADGIYEWKRSGKSKHP